jgi:threonine/homoserine efflux transporter RhtA
MKSFLFVLLFFACLSACNHKHSTDSTEIVGVWKSSKVQISSVVEPASKTIELRVLSGNTFEIVTSISPFTQPLSGVWAINSGTTKLDLAGISWKIHHLSGSSMRLIGTLDSKEFDVDFVK